MAKKHKIGDIVEFNGIKVRIEESKQRNCLGCAYKDEPNRVCVEACNRFGDCLDFDDSFVCGYNKMIIFKKVE